MAIDLGKTKDGTAVWLTEKVKDYEAGTAMIIKKIMDLKGKKVALVAIAGQADARTIPAEGAQLSLSAPKAAASASKEEEPGDLTGPVAEYFSQFFPMDTQVATDFLGDYIGDQGTDDTDMLDLAIETAGFQTAESLDEVQAAKVYLAYADVTGADPNEDAQKIVAEAEEPKKETAKEKAARIKAERDAAKKAAEEPEKPVIKKQPAAKTTSERVYNANKVAAANIAAALLPFLADSPETFVADVELGIKIAQKGWSVEA